MPVIGSAHARTPSPTPSRSRIDSDPGFSVSPHSLSRGNDGAIDQPHAHAGARQRQRRHAARRPGANHQTRRIAFSGRVPAPARCSSIRSPRQLQSAASMSAGARRVRNEIHVARRIRIVEVDRRRQQAVRHRQRGRGHAGRAARALRMADHRLRRRSRHAIGVAAEDAADAPRLDAIVQLRRRAVIVDVADLLRRALRAGTARFRCSARSRRRPDPSARGDRRRRSRRSLRCARRSCAPRARARSSRSSTSIHAPSPSTKPSRPRSNGRDAAAGPIVVARGHRAHAREAEDHARQHAAVGAARQQHVVLAGANQRRGVADRVGRARAAARQHVAHAAQAERDRDLARHHAADADGNRVRRHVPAAGGEEVLVLLFADVDAAAAAADEHAGAGLARAQSGIAPRFARGDHAEQRRARIALRIGAPVLIVVAIERRARRRSTRAAPTPRPGRDRSRRRTA